MVSFLRHTDTVRGTGAKDVTVVTSIVPIWSQHRDNQLQLARLSSHDLMQTSGLTGYVIGKLASVDILKCMNISGKMRQGECTQWHM